MTLYQAPIVGVARARPAITNATQAPPRMNFVFIFISPGGFHIYVGRPRAEKHPAGAQWRSEDPAPAVRPAVVTVPCSAERIEPRTRTQHSGESRGKPDISCQEFSSCENRVCPSINRGPQASDRPETWAHPFPLKSS